jgi:hypothetical protein
VRQQTLEPSRQGGGKLHPIPGKRVLKSELGGV